MMARVDDPSSAMEAHVHRRLLGALSVGMGVVVALGLTVQASTANPGRTPQQTAASAEQTAIGQRPPRPVRIATAGDIACQPPYAPRHTTCRHAATARLIQDRGVRAVLPLGDTQYETGAPSDYLQSYDPTWGKFWDRSFPVPGNHEYKTPGASGYYDYFAERARGPKGYYAYGLGRWRMYALNSNCGAIDCDAEVTWLLEDLRAHPQRCSLAYMHHPRFSSGLHGDSSEAARLWPVLDRRQVDVVLAGHDHDYERFAPMTSAGSLSDDGIRSFVVGTGGKEIRGFTTRRAGSRARENDLAGALFMTLWPRSYRWSFRTVDGGQHDSGTGDCVI